MGGALILLVVERVDERRVKVIKVGEELKGCEHSGTKKLKEIEGTCKRELR